MSTNLNELTNTPISFEIGGKTVKIVRLNLSEIFGYFEAKVKEIHLKNVKDVANMFDTTKEKMDYLKQATREIPNKSELQRLAYDYLQTTDGFADILTIGLNKCQKITDEELVDIFKNATEVESEMVMNYMLGIERPKDEQKADEDKKK